VAHVPGPYQVVPAQVLVSHELAPGDAQRGDDGPVVKLVLVGENEAVAAAVQAAPVAGHYLFHGRQVLAGTPPLLNEPLALIAKGGGEGLRKSHQCVMKALAEGESLDELPAVSEIEFADQSNVAVAGTVELPVHPEVPHQVLPAVAGPHVPAGTAGKRHRGSQCQPGATFVRRQHRTRAGFDDVAVVAPATDFEVRRQQDEQPQLRRQFHGRLQAGMHEHAGLVRVRDDFLEDAVASPGLGVGDPKAEGVAVQVFVGVVQVTPLVVAEGGAVRDKVLQVADLGPIDRWIVDLVEDALG
jgi:hypothetical protein